MGSQSNVNNNKNCATHPRRPVAPPHDSSHAVSPHINAGSGQRRDSYCYPVTYGTSCVAHDIVEPPYCGIRDAAGVRARDTIDDEDKAWCRGSWCYIDPEVRDACSYV